METIKNIVDNVLYEKKNEKSLKVFYNADIAISSEEEGDLFLKDKGVINIPKDKALNILSLNDLLATLQQGNTKIINELVSEIILALSGQKTENVIQDLLKENDKCNITLDYGLAKDDSIGVQVSKNKSVESASLIMRKDGSVFGSGKFNKAVFDQTIRNVFLKEIK